MRRITEPTWEEIFCDSSRIWCVADHSFKEGLGMAIIQRSASVAWSGDLKHGSGSLTSESNVLAQTPLTFPGRMNEPDASTSPEELIAAAHAGCYAMSIANALTQAKEAFDSLEVHATVGLDRVDGGLRIMAAHVDAVVASATLDDDRCAELASTADERCPVSNALRASAEVTVAAKVSRSLP